MIARTSKRDAKRVQTARRLMRSAVKLCGERGYDDWTIDDLAERANVSRRTVFNYFDTKADIVLGPEPEVRDEAIEAFVNRRPTGRMIDDILVLAGSCFDANATEESIADFRRIIINDPQLLSLVHRRFEELAAQFTELIQQREGAAYPAYRARLLIRLLVTALDVAVERMPDNPHHDFTDLFIETVHEARSLLTD